MEKTILDFVEKDPLLWGEMQNLLKKKYLLPGIFHQHAYLVNDTRSQLKWKNRNKESLKRIDWLAIGVTIYNQFFGELANDLLQGGDGSARQETSKWLEEWEKEVQASYVENTGDNSVPDIALKLGQYLEYRNRKSQGL